MGVKTKIVISDVLIFLKVVCLQALYQKKINLQERRMKSDVVISSKIGQKRRNVDRSVNYKILAYFYKRSKTAVDSTTPNPSKNKITQHIALYWFRKGRPLMIYLVHEEQYFW